MSIMQKNLLNYFMNCYRIIKRSFMEHYLVTGGGGFIGSNIVEKLVSMGKRVRVLDNFSTGKRENLKHLNGKIEIIEGDIRSYHIVMEAVKGVDYVLHQAALPSVPRSVKDPLTTNEVNITGTLNLLTASRDEGVKRFIFASSSSVYGDSDALPKIETMKPNPKSPYAISKLAGEYYCNVFYKLYSLPTIALRYFNVFGYKQDPNSQYSAVIPKFLSSINEGKEITIYGDGSQTRDFTFIENVINANLLAVESDKSHFGDFFNVACGDSISLNQMVEHMFSLTGKKTKIKYEEPRVGDVKHSLADITKISSGLKYKPSVNTKDGLSKII